MTTFRCDACNKTTYDVDIVPCGESVCAKMRLREIATIHYAEKINDKYEIPCKPKQKGNLNISNTLTAVTCAKCFEVLKSRTETKVSGKEEKSSDSEFWKSLEWEDLGYPPDLVEKLKLKFNSPSELKTHVDQSLSLPENLTETEKEIVIAAIESLGN